MRRYKWNVKRSELMACFCFENNRKNATFAEETKPNLMTKRLFPLLIVILFAIVACNPGSKDTGSEDKNDTTFLTVLTFQQQADSCIDKPVIIEGTVFHLCKHGGKRLFLVDGTDSIRIEVTTGPNITKFDDALVGSRLRVVGTLKEERIDAKYLNEWEAELTKPEEDHSVGIHTGALGHEDQGVKEKLEQIAELREDIKNSGKDHLSFFSIEADSFIELK
ncbi:MAG: OB-fold nucleic acid binding domain-containing protein [Bacteroidales bacterium]|nr:OB-fold nucleic acid binding domain-containing protein [Bacteroidales bacterium]